MTRFTRAKFASATGALLALLLGLASTDRVAAESLVETARSDLPDVIDVSTAGSKSLIGAYDPDLSRDGRFVAFVSQSPNLVSGDTNGPPEIGGADIFLRDRLLRTTVRVSVASDGSQASADSFAPSISADGRFIAFQSWATNLIVGAWTTPQSVYLHDRVLHTTILVSARGQYPAISGSGRYVAYEQYVPADNPDATVVRVYDTQTHRLTSVAPGRSIKSWTPSLSDDGRYVAFRADFRHKRSKLLVRDRRTGTTSRADLGLHQRPANRGSDTLVLSGNGRFLAFRSEATNLVPNDRNGGADVFVRDLKAHVTTQASIGPRGTPAPRCPRYQEDPGEWYVTPCGSEPAISTTGRLVKFTSSVFGRRSGDVYVRDMRRHVTTALGLRLVWGLRGSNNMSGNGRFVAFLGDDDHIYVQALSPRR